MGDPRRFLDYLDSERKAALLYRALAETVDGDRRAALLELADMEDAHAGHWVDKLVEAGIEVPPKPVALDPSDESLVARARTMGLTSILTTLEETEAEAESVYDEEPEASSTMAADERLHAEAFRSMNSAAPTKPQATRPMESRHRIGQSGALRATIFGVSDGLVSNTALVMGFAGANPDGRTVLFAGLAGLLAGAFSMAAGEYVSMASQRDLYKREIAMEAAELHDKPEEERKELELIYRAKGLSREQAAAVADQIMSDPDSALETLVREELGLNPDDLGSPVHAAASSFLAFAVGASVVVIPYVFATGTLALTLAIVLSLIGMTVVGGLVGKFSGRGVVVSAARQLAWGIGAAAVTYGIGSVIGVSVGA